MPHPNPAGNERPIHRTVPALVWADIDEGVVDMIRRLNEIPGVRTNASCQGTIGEGGPRPYPAHVMAHWMSEESLEEIRREYDGSNTVEQQKAFDVSWKTLEASLVAYFAAYRAQFPTEGTAP